MKPTKRQAVGLIVGLLSGVVIVGAVYLAAVGSATVQAIRTSQVHRAPTIDNTAKAARAAEMGTNRIEDCTTPGRSCYERGQRQLADTVARLTLGNQRAAAAAAACATQVHTITFQTVYRCVRHATGTAHPRKR